MWFCTFLLISSQEVSLVEIVAVTVMLAFVPSTAAEPVTPALGAVYVITIVSVSASVVIAVPSIPYLSASTQAAPVDVTVKVVVAPGATAVTSLLSFRSVRFTATDFLTPPTVAIAVADSATGSTASTAPAAAAPISAGEPSFTA
ncbi:MAG: hypothetical protein K2N60_03725 [Oscillospiraceae bacterium]|nr:hypothetical protein [Oscillospiraceae bacterium]